MHSEAAARLRELSEIPGEKCGLLQRISSLNVVYSAIVLCSAPSERYFPPRQGLMHLQVRILCPPLPVLGFT